MPFGPHDGVLMIAHGTVTDLEDLPAFVANIRRGRPAPPGLVQELRRRYAAIGSSPLLEVTKAQAHALSRTLDVPVLVGMRLWRPTVEDVLRGIGGLGLRRLVVVPLAPFSVDVYWRAACESLERVRGALGREAPELVKSEPWGSEPAFVRAHAGKIRAALAGGDAPVVLTAHSLPAAVIRAGDAYEMQFRAAAAEIARCLDHELTLAFQSQGADGGEWLGPDLRTALERVSRTGAKRVIVSPVGFPAEHVETLYDLDIEARAWARDLGLELVRIPALGADAGLIEALGRIARRALEQNP
jgi:ferrochelatase